VQGFFTSMSHGLSEFILIWRFYAQVTFIIIIPDVENYICVLSIQARVKAIAKNQSPGHLINFKCLIHVPNE